MVDSSHAEVSLQHMLSKIREAAEKVGEIPELARRLGVSRQAIDAWTEVPPERAPELDPDFMPGPAAVP